MKTILIVDDEPNFLLSLRDGLDGRQEGFKILLAGDGLEAVEILRHSTVDLLVTDLKLPRMDGFQLLAFVSRFSPQLPIIVMTAFGTPEIEARLRRQKSLIYLEKPLDFDLLVQSIQQALQGDARSYIHGITLATFLQLLSMERKTCTLKIKSRGRTGYLFIRRGELIDAEMADLLGQPAAMEIATWDDAEIEMDGICRRQEVRIEASLEFLLMEAFRLRDEQEEALVRGAATSDRDQIQSPANASGGSEGRYLQRLGTLLRESPGIIEAVIFDSRGFPEFCLPLDCSLARRELSAPLRLVEELGSFLAAGEVRYLVFNTRSLVRYLLFQADHFRVAVGLKPGVRPADLMTTFDQLRCG